MKTIVSCLFFLLGFLLSACKKEQSVIVSSEQTVYILNEGNFQIGNTSLSVFDPKTNSVSNDVFYQTNHFQLGDVGQSMLPVDSTLFVVLNNSSKITVLNSNQAFQKKYDITIPGGSPRFMQIVGNQKAYVTELYANKIWIADLNNKIISGSIAVSGWTEQLYPLDGKVFVAQRQKPGGPKAAALLVLDPGSNTINKTISLNSDPTGLAVDEKEHRLYICCEAVSGNAVIYQLNTSSASIVDSILLPAIPNPRFLDINANGDLFFASGSVYRILKNSKSIQQFVEGHGNEWYGLNVNKSNGDVYVSDAIDYVQASHIFRYDSTGKLLTSFTAGINSNGFVFKQ
ncbi:MAG: hypothetical protein U0T73_09760 [Chitinophagales bacterium]